MSNKIYAIIGLILGVVFSSCNNKPKPVSSDIAKTAVTVNGQKDSVFNNTQKKYGNATVSEPCVKCLIQVVQGTTDYKALMQTSTAVNVNYVVNWAGGQTSADTSSNHSATSALKLDVIEKGNEKNKIATFIYDNSLSKLFFVDKGSNVDLKINSADLKKIRNKCYWGVASSK